MNVLIACEESQRVCTEFRKRGHNAFSIDILPCSGGHPEWHIQGDVFKVLNPKPIQVAKDDLRMGVEFYTNYGQDTHTIFGKWDLIIAHPPCTHLAASGARHFSKKRENGEQEKAIRFFVEMLFADCEKICVENPVGIISGKYVLDHYPDIAKEFGLPIKPDQIINPWQFAVEDDDKTVKNTCLWLKGLPKLQPIHKTKPAIQYKEWTTKTGKKKRQSQWYYATRCAGKKERARLASKTFKGIAKAMAEQWG